MRQSVKLSSVNEFGFTKTCTVKHVHYLVKFPVDDGFAAVDVFDPHLDVVAECSACHLQTVISVLHGSAADPARAVKEAVVQPLYGPAVAGEPQGEHVACLAGACVHLLPEQKSDFGFGVQMWEGCVMPTVSVGFYIWEIPVAVGVGLVCAAAGGMM